MKGRIQIRIIWDKAASLQYWARNKVQLDPKIVKSRIWSSPQKDIVGLIPLTEGYFMHCPENDLNNCIKPEPVTDGVDATGYVWFLCQTRTVAFAATATGSFFLWRFRLFFGTVWSRRLLLTEHHNIERRKKISD